MGLDCALPCLRERHRKTTRRIANSFIDAARRSISYEAFLLDLY
jgi:hypothetical protein